MNSNRLWRSIAAIIVLTALFAQAARILSIGGRNDSTPFFSANDRSRWCTIASLVEEHTYEIDAILEIKDPEGQSMYRTIDKVRHVGSDGKQHYYSSKPPLLATLFAGVYQVIYWSTGMLLSEEPFAVGRAILLVVNWIPLALFWWWVSRWIGEELPGLWAKTAMLLFVVWGTFLSTFANTLSNHLSGALATALGIAAWRAVEQKTSRQWAWIAVAGAGSAMAVASDLPSLSWFAALAGVFVMRVGIASVLPYGLGALPVVLAFGLTNYLAHGELSPAYAHRGIGKEIATLEKRGNEPPAVQDLVSKIDEHNLPTDELSRLQKAGRLECLELTDKEGDLRYAIVDREDRWSICEWDDWYDYPGSYWRKNGPKGVDRGEPSTGTYAFHVILGHHGILSLTPFWVVAMIGLVPLFRSKDWSQRWMIGAIFSVTIVCLGFYLSRPEIDRNYGGVSCGFRWAFWMIPLWFLPTMEGLKVLRRNRTTRRMVEWMIAVSVLSANYAWTNPWVHPWLFQFLSYLGWIDYSN